MQGQYQQGYGQPQGYSGYQNHNWQGYQMKPMLFDKNNIDTMGLQLFQKHDYDRSGSLNIMEMNNLINEFYRMQGKQGPSFMDIQYMCNKFDYNRDGQISWHEFRMMLK